MNIKLRAHRVVAFFAHQKTTGIRRFIHREDYGSVKLFCSNMVDIFCSDGEEISSTVTRKAGLLKNGGLKNLSLHYDLQGL